MAVRRQIRRTARCLNITIPKDLVTCVRWEMKRRAAGLQTRHPPQEVSTSRRLQGFERRDSRPQPK